MECFRLPSFTLIKTLMDLLPVDLELSTKGLLRWIQKRMLPKHRIYSDLIFFCMGFDRRDLTAFLDASNALSINNSYWVIPEGFSGRFAKYNLYQNLFTKELSEVSFSGKPVWIHDFASSPELTTNGRFPKVWRLDKDGLSLWKSGSQSTDSKRINSAGKEPYCEAYACQIGKAMGLQIVSYHLRKWNDTIASVCPIFTSPEVSYVPAGKLQNTIHSQSIWQNSYQRTAMLYQSLGQEFYEQFCSMMVFDALICNEDRHFGNFGFLANAKTNQILAPAHLFDHGLSLLYDIPKEQTKTIASMLQYARSRKSCMGADFIEQAAPYLGSRQKEQLKKVLNFRFEKEEFNLPARYLHRLERVIQGRAALLLERAESCDSPIDQE